MSKLHLRASALACSLLALVCLMPESAGQDPEPEVGPLRILVTNDDGIQTLALAQLVAALAELGEVVVCAPDGNRSGTSQSVVAWSAPMSVSAAEVEGASLAVAVGGNPADAACYGLLELGKDAPFDLVVSGINEGANVGEVSHYSGTVGAAMEAAYRGVPAIAVSYGGRARDYSECAAFTARFASQLLAREPRPGLVYSINFPPGSAEDLKGVAACAMEGSYLVIRGWAERDTAQGEAGAVGRLQFLRSAGEAGGDTRAYLDGYVTVTPLQWDWTDRAALADLESWELSVE